MPKLPLVSGSQVLRALKRLGFEQLRQSGSHVILRRGSSPAVVPLHRELKLGTLNGILRQSQVSPDEFIAALD